MILEYTLSQQRGGRNGLVGILKTVEEQLVENIVNLQFDSLPRQAVEITKRDIFEVGWI